MFNKRIYAIIVILFILVSIVSCSSENLSINKNKTSETTKINITENNKNTDEPVEFIEEKFIEEKSENILDKNIYEKNNIDEIKSKLNTMSLEEKIGQMFICAFRRDNSGNGITTINHNSIEAIKEYGIGGVVLFSENISDKQQTEKYINDLKIEADIPLFIGIDEEGGRVIRTGALDLPKIPSAQSMGETKDKSVAYGYATEIAKYLKELGFNLDFAPVADINSNPKNRVIGDRSFGKEPDLVADMAISFSMGLEENGILSCLKHFPGHGDTLNDSHYGIASVDSSLERLEEIEFVPFEKGIQSGVSFIMVGHISAPNITGDYEPAIFSKLLVTDILKNKLGFNGIVTTDALDMGAITKYYTSSETAINAVKAGIDILLMPSDFKEAYNGLLNAVKTGEISEDRIDESVYKILVSKQKIK